MSSKRAPGPHERREISLRRGLTPSGAPGSVLGWLPEEYREVAGAVLAEADESGVGDRIAQQLMTAASKVDTSDQLWPTRVIAEMKRALRRYAV